jgi:hypothetical protein
MVGSIHAFAAAFAQDTIMAAAVLPDNNGLS